MIEVDGSRKERRNLKDLQPVCFISVKVFFSKKNGKEKKNQTRLLESSKFGTTTACGKSKWREDWREGDNL